MKSISHETIMRYRQAVEAGARISLTPEGAVTIDWSDADGETASVLDRKLLKPAVTRDIKAMIKQARDHYWITHDRLAPACYPAGVPVCAVRDCPMPARDQAVEVRGFCLNHRRRAVMIAAAGVIDAGALDYARRLATTGSEVEVAAAMKFYLQCMDQVGSLAS